MRRAFYYLRTTISLKKHKKSILIFSVECKICQIFLNQRHSNKPTIYKSTQSVPGMPNNPANGLICSSEGLQAVPLITVHAEQKNLYINSVQRNALQFTVLYCLVKSY
jgi:hypothetical protein